MGRPEGGGLGPEREAAGRVLRPGSAARQHAAVLRWYATRREKYPWRGERDPYRILVIEVMAQQTQASRLEPFYREWLRRFPDVGTLAAASRSDVLRTWGRLGYYRRPVALHEAARAIVGEHGGVVPTDPAKLLALPGIGPYTANAVASLSAEVRVPLVDTNSRRVVARARLGVDAAEVSDRLVAAEAAAWLPSPLGSGAGRRLREWNQALMDLGAEVCVRVPRCGACPLLASCRYRAAGRTGAAPRSLPPFRGSRRQLRGRVLERLRGAGPAGVAVAELGLPVGESSSLLRMMEREGLVRLDRGNVRFPD